mmetsp:Transcript_16259/g.44785  ORF Transcript_16259/g.44785 Transcript_16259/m.44785 type:complete len:368 (-) Transcript_16259:52-1155(-)
MGEDDGRKLFTGRLPGDITEEEIRYVFNTYGKVVDVHLHAKEGHGGLRSAFVFYDTRTAAEAAIKVLHEVYKFREDSKEPITVGYPRSKDSDRPRDDRPRDDRGFSGRHGLERVNRSPDDRSGDERRGGHERGHERRSGHDRGGSYSRGGGPDRGNQRGGCDRGSPERCRRRSSRDRGSRERGGHDRGGYERGGYDRGGCDRGGLDRGSYERYDHYARPERYERPERCQHYERYDRYERYDDRIGDRSRDRRPGGCESRNGGGKGGGKKGIPGNKLYVANLPTDITRDAIMYVFSTYGRVQDIHIMTGRSKSGMAAAFIVYTYVDQAKKCLMAMQQGYEIRPGQGNIIVKYADDQGGPGGGGRSRPH